MYFLQSLKTKVLIIPRSKKYKAITLTLDSAVLTINPSKNVDQRKEKEEEKRENNSKGDNEIITLYQLW